MNNKAKIETIAGFSYNSIYSQIAAALTLTSTNVLEVMKIRLI